MSEVKPFRFATQEDAIRYTARIAFQSCPIVNEDEATGCAAGLIAGLFGDADHAPHDVERWVRTAKEEYMRLISSSEAEHS